MVVVKRRYELGVVGGFVLFLYGIVPTFQPSYFHRIYAAYGGVFIEPGRDNINQCRCNYCLILLSSNSGNRGWLSCMVMDTQEQGIALGTDWWSCVVPIWNNPNITTCKLWKSLCSLWWDLYSLIHFMGIVSRQKETRQI